MVMHSETSLMMRQSLALLEWKYAHCKVVFPAADLTNDNRCGWTTADRRFAQDLTSIEVYETPAFERGGG